MDLSEGHIIMICLLQYRGNLPYIDVRYKKQDKDLLLTMSTLTLI